MPAPDPAVIAVKNIPRIVIGRKPFPIENINHKMKLMKTDSGLPMAKEFEDITAASKQLNFPCSVAESPENREKNRYRDILPCIQHIIVDLKRFDQLFSLNPNRRPQSSQTGLGSQCADGLFRLRQRVLHFGKKFRIGN
jgi:hypothetical protein